jgi:hypothetical protein
MKKDGTFLMRSSIILGYDSQKNPTTRGSLLKISHCIPVAKSFFLFTPHPDPLPQGESGIKRKELLAIPIDVSLSKPSVF